MKILSQLSPTSWLTTKTVFSQIFALLLFAIQAPLLGPKAFGLISIVMVFVGFCEYVPGEAAAESLISIREIEPAHFHTMTAANVLLSVAIGIGVFAGAHRIAGWFGDPELAGILHWMAILPAISAFAAAPTAATKRDMQFQPIALRSIGSLFVGGMVGLVLTLVGVGVWALVWQAIITRLVASVVLWYAVPLKFGMGFSGRHFRELAHFAAPTMISRFLTWSCNQIPRLMLGLYWGSTDLGLFSLAARLGDVLMEVAVVPRYTVARVELRQYVDDHAGLDAALRRTLTFLTVFCFPLCVGGAAIVPTLFHVWLDPRWIGAILPAQCLLLTCVPLVTQYIGGAALLAMNRQKTEAVISITQTVTTLIAVVACAPFGLLAASIGIAARPFVLLPLSVGLLRRYCAISVSTIFLPQWPALAASLVMGACVWLLRLALQPIVRDAVALPILVLAGAAIYALMVRLTMPTVVAEVVNRLPGRA
ncbi:MAG TPA: oligosaccharide flippase family protein [Steroidobacteraceae bacterium]|nr:oligosaccharide flippase family protein [Steroidobacteraceae bacterium]